MFIGMISGLAVGALLGLRFNVIILIPGNLLSLLFAAASGIARGDGLWSITATMALAVAGLQVGYLLGCALAMVPALKRSAHTATPPIPSGASRSG